MRVQLADVSVDSLEDIVGTECYDEALLYVRQHAVVQQVWVAAQNALCGVVRVRPGEFHTPAIYFADGQVSSAQCSCTARYGCAHAAALLMAAADQEPDTDPEPATAPQPAIIQEPEPATGRLPSWQRSLDSLFDDPDAPGQAIETPLAIELTLTYGRLMARLLQPGKNGTWI
jgi:hypothetical protein